MFAAILRLALQLFAGLGIGKVLDKVAADKLPSYKPSGVLDNEAGGVDVPKVAWFLVTMIAGAMLAKFIGKKFNIKLLK